MKSNLHIIEPTLSGEAGHCQSFVASLCRAGSALQGRFTVWGGRRASLPAQNGVDLSLRRFFFRRVRRVQEFFLLRRLLKGTDRIFISTAGRVDLLLLEWAAASEIPARRVFLYFHWVRPDRKKLACFARLALRHPELVILGPTQSVIDVFTGCGFRNCMVVPYPITPQLSAQLPAQPFRHLLFAGAARSDKGFAHVVELLALLAAKGEELPVALQTSSERRDKYDAQTRGALERLASLDYPQLALAPETLSTEAYFGMFAGAICLQPYDQVAFADRISGITLDGLSMGAPLVTLAGTWMARAVERFDAGVVVGDASPELLLGAVRTILSDYARYRSNAFRAGLALQREHSAGHLLDILTA